MVDLNLLGGVNVSGMMKSVTTILYFIIIFGVLGLAGWFTWLKMSYKVHVVVRKIAGDRTLTFKDKARIIKKKGKPIRWKLQKLKDYIPVPPKDAIDITTKGKQWLECYYTQDGEYVYLIDDLHKNSDVGSLYPLKNSDKEFYAQQLEEANKYKTRKLSDILMQMAPIMAIIMILVIFMIFFDKVVAPTGALAGSLQEASKSLASAINTMQSCTQTIGGVIPS